MRKLLFLIPMILCLLLPLRAAAADVVVSGVVPSPIALTSPTAGETWPAGSVQTIGWDTASPAVAMVSLYYSTDGGNSYPFSIAENIANNQRYRWTVPVQETSRARIEIVAKDDTGTVLGTDDSKDNFSIVSETATESLRPASAPLVVISPSTGLVTTTALPVPSPVPEISGTQKTSGVPGHSDSVPTPATLSSNTPAPLLARIATAIDADFTNLVTTPVGRTSITTSVAVLSVSGPVLSALVSALVTTSGSPISAVHYLLFFWKPRRKKYWGKVYDSSNRLPVVGAEVGLVPQTIGGAIRRTITDPNGGYGFFLNESGQYIVSASANGFGSYTGKPEFIEPHRLDARQVISLIRDNSLNKSQTGWNVDVLSVIVRWFDRLSPFFIFAGASFAVFNLIVFRDWLSVLILVVYVLVIGQQVARYCQASIAGSVLDNRGQVIPHVRIQIYKVTQTEQVAVGATLSDGKGFYSLRLKGGMYLVMATKDGYETYTSQPMVLGKRASGDLNIVLESFSYTRDSNDK